jgi:hypothetical protein
MYIWLDTMRSLAASNETRQDPLRAVSRTNAAYLDPRPLFDKAPDGPRANMLLDINTH